MRALFAAKDDRYAPEGLTARAVDARIPLEWIAFHFHDTRGTALANVAAAMSSGIRTFDASTGGTGGCPYAPGAAGNLATEDLVYLLDAIGLEHGVDLDGVLVAARFIADTSDVSVCFRWRAIAVSSSSLRCTEP